MSFTFKYPHVNKKINKKSLNVWMDNCDSDFQFLVYKLFAKTRNINLISNLSTIKKSLELELDNNLLNYRLFKGYLNSIDRDNFNAMYYRTLLGILVAVVIAFLTKKPQQLPVFTGIGLSEEVLKIIYIFFCIGFGCITFVLLVVKINENKLRVTLIKEIIDISIKEEEEKVAKNLQ
jgi:hypothetical protein